MAIANASVLLATNVVGIVSQGSEAGSAAALSSPLGFRSYLSQIMGKLSPIVAARSDFEVGISVTSTAMQPSPTGFRSYLSQLMSHVFGAVIADPSAKMVVVAGSQVSPSRQYWG